MSGQTYVRPDRTALPQRVRVLRVVLIVGAVLTAVTMLAYLFVVGVTPESAGEAVWAMVPGVLALLAVRRIRRPGRGLWWLVLGAALLWLLGALGTLGLGDPRGVTQLVLPIVILVVAGKRETRDYLRDRG